MQLLSVIQLENIVFFKYLQPIGHKTHYSRKKNFEMNCLRSVSRL
jgi:hypothetical protein